MQCVQCVVTLPGLSHGDGCRSFPLFSKNNDLGEQFGKGKGTIAYMVGLPSSPQRGLLCRGQEEAERRGTVCKAGEAKAKVPRRVGLIPEKASTASASMLPATVSPVSLSCCVPSSPPSYRRKEEAQCLFPFVFPSV